MRLYLVNPLSPLVQLADVKQNRWNRYRIWKPLGLLVLAGLTPRDWEVTLIDENLEAPDYAALPRPDLVGITAFTSQAGRAYDVAGEFRGMGVKVVMGGIHATMCQAEALRHVDSVVAGEADGVWGQVLSDVQHGRLQRLYEGAHVDMASVKPARHDLLPGQYAFGSIQTTRGCPLNCDFCSVSAFSGGRYRQRPIDDVIAELKTVPEKRVLIVDDNLIGTTPTHIERAKNLFRGMIREKVNKRWMGQVTINMADDEELLSLAAKSGCLGLYIGFESPSEQGLAELGKRYNLRNNRDFPASVRRIQRHGILIVGSFILGLDSDEPGVGSRIAQAATHYGVDILNALILTPLPGTRLWDRLHAQDRIAASDFPRDWKYYTLGLPTALYKRFSWPQILAEMTACDSEFYSLGNLFRRVLDSLLHRRHPFWSLVSNMSCRNNIRTARRSFTWRHMPNTPAAAVPQRGHWTEPAVLVAQVVGAAVGEKPGE
jgi:radical SAM superfamily enzyme YgiQ (UPF0313 family)